MNPRGQILPYAGATQSLSLHHFEFYGPGLRQIRDDLLVAGRQVYSFAERLGPINPCGPVDFKLITVRVFEVQADGSAMADRADNRHVVLEEKTVEFFDVGQTEASERNLLHHLTILSLAVMKALPVSGFSSLILSPTMSL
jgi:hypothetical protein